MRTATLLLLFMTAPAVAQDPILITGTDGRSYNGRILEVSPSGVVFEYAIEGGIGKRRFHFAELTQPSQYVVMKEATAKDAPGELALAALARDLGLFDQARRHLSQAVSLGSDANEAAKNLAALDDTQAGTMLKTARDLMAAGKWRSAEPIARQILERFPARSEAREAVGLIREILIAMRSARAHPVTIEEVGRHRETVVKRRAQFDRIANLMIEAERFEAKGLEQGFSGQALRHFREGLNRVAEATKLALVYQSKSYAEDEDVTPVTLCLKNLGVRINVSIANVYLAKSSYPRAVEYANQALAIDPESKEAAAVKSRAGFAAAVSHKP